MSWTEKGNGMYSFQKGS